MNLLRFHCRFERANGFVLDREFATDALVTAITGPSGVGKSTVVHLLAGLLRPCQGSISFGDRLWVSAEPRVFVKPEQRNVGVVFQDLRLFPHLTVKQNLLFSKRSSKREIPFESVVESLELATLLSRYPATLSGGQQQRVALGRAWLRGPDLLLMDEPFTGIDESLKSRLIDFCKALIEQWEMQTILVTHDADDLAKLAGHVLRM